MGKTENRLAFILAGGAACAITFAPALGQQLSSQQTAGQSGGTGSGLSVTLDYLSTFRYDDNLSLDDPSRGSTTRWENVFTLGVLKQTPNSQLSLDLSGLHRISNQPVIGSDAEFNDPRMRLAYSRDSTNSKLSTSAEYSERDLTFSQSLTDTNQNGVIDPGDIAIDAGNRTLSRFNLNWQTGINDPIGAIFRYNHGKIDYQNTTDPDLFDNQINFYSLTALLRISPVLQGNVKLDHTDYKAEDAPRIDRQTTTLTTGLTYDVSPVTTISGNLGITQVDETRRAVPSSSSDEDFVASASWTRALPNGTANALLDHSFGTNGSRTTAQAGRSIVLPNGSFYFSVGVTHGPSGETTPIGDIGYTHTLNTSQITASLSRQVGTSTLSTETQETRANLNYDYFINPLSSASFGVNYVEQADEGVGPSNRRQRANFNASYTRALTQDWNITTGYQYRINNNSGPGSATGNALFVTLGRQFDLKP